MKTVIRTLFVLSTCLMAAINSIPNEDETEFHIESILNNPVSSSLAYRPEGFEALEPVLLDVCSYLKIRDRCNLSQVCSMLRQVVKRANFRDGPEFQVIQIQEIRAQSESVSSLGNICQIIKVKPKLSLFFYNDDEFSKVPFITPDAILGEYVHQLPKDSPIVCLEGMSTILNRRNIKASENSATGLFFPENDKKARILTEAIHDYYMNGDEYNEDVPREFLKQFRGFGGSINRLKNPMGLIMFHMHFEAEDAELEELFMYNRHARNIVKELENDYRKFGSGGPAIWGGNVFWMNSNGFRIDPVLPTTSFAMAIAGPMVRSWSLAINSTAPQQSIKEKIVYFAETIRYDPGRAIALSLQTTSPHESHEARVSKDQIFSAVFPGLQLFSFGLVPGLTKYCVDSTFTEVPQSEIQIKYSDEYVCYLVISY